MPNKKWSDIEQEEAKLSRKKELITIRNFTQMLAKLVKTSRSLDELGAKLDYLEKRLNKEIDE